MASFAKPLVAERTSGVKEARSIYLSDSLLIGTFFQGLLPPVTSWKVGLSMREGMEIKHPDIKVGSFEPSTPDIISCNVQINVPHPAHLMKHLWALRQLVAADLAQCTHHCTPEIEGWPSGSWSHYVGLRVSRPLAKIEHVLRKIWHHSHRKMEHVQVANCIVG